VLPLVSGLVVPLPAPDPPEPAPVLPPAGGTAPLPVVPVLPVSPEPPEPLPIDPEPEAPLPAVPVLPEPYEEPAPVAVSLRFPVPAEPEPPYVEPEPVAPLPDPVVPTSELEPVEVEPLLPAVEPVDPVLPDDWANANGAAPSIPMRTSFFVNPFIVSLSRRATHVEVGRPRCPERVGRGAGRHH